MPTYASRIKRRVGLCWVTTVFYELRSELKTRPRMGLASPPGLSVELLSSENISSLTEVWPVDVHEMRQRLQRGDLCYAGFLEGRIAHYSWVQLAGAHRVTEANLNLPVEPKEFWIYHCRTAEWARGNGIYPHMLIRIVSEQFRAGRELARIYTTSENLPSQRGIVRAGFKQESTVRRFRVGHYYF